MHIKIDKLDDITVKCVFNGYPKGVKGYKLSDMEPGESRVIISSNVNFDETMYEDEVQRHV